jgi:RNA polymerase sigma factor (sigma-70 family)
MKELSEIFVENLRFIDAMAEDICHRYGVNGPADLDEFAGSVRMQLIENDYAVLRRFRGESKLTTYLRIVVHRAFLDYLVRKWGKWYPSAAAKRLGDTAVALERLLHRDGNSIDEALLTIRTKDPTIGRADLVHLAAKLPVRPRRPRLVDFAELDALGAQVPTSNTNVFAADHASMAQQISEIVRDYVDQLPEEDKVMFRLHFAADMRLAEISRALHVNQKAAYRRLQEWLRELRARLTAAGIGADDVTEILGSTVTPLDFGLENPDRRRDSQRSALKAAAHERR